MKAFALLLIAGLAACSHADVQLNGGVGVQGGGTGANALIGLGILGSIVYLSENRGYGVRYNANPFLAITDSARAPELSPARRVIEQDCTRPIEDTSANLRCR